MGTNNIISKAQRNKTQQSFQPVKAQRKMRNLIFLIPRRSTTSAMNFLIQLKRNTIPHLRNRIFWTKLKRNLRSAIEISQYNANTKGGVKDTRPEARAKDTKKSEAKAKNSPSEDRPSRGQGQECSRPRTMDTGANVSPKIFFRRSQKKGLQKKNFASARAT